MDRKYSRPWRKAMGPAGLDLGYPAQPPSLATIHPAQAREFGGCGFFCRAVLPSSSGNSAWSVSISAGEKTILAGCADWPSRAWTSCMMAQAARAAMAVSLISRSALSNWLSSSCRPCCLSVRKNCSMVQRCRYQPTTRQAIAASSIAWVVNTNCPEHGLIGGLGIGPRVRFSTSGHWFTTTEGLMSAAVKISRTDHTAEALRGLAAKSNDGGQVRRLLALALILEGHSREVAAELAGMERQTLPDWVHRYNAQGVAGLCSIRIGGRRCYLSEAQMAELKAVAIKGPDPETDKVVRWRCVDFRDAVARRFTVTVTERTIAKGCRRFA